MSDLAAVIEKVARGIEAGRFRGRAKVSQGVVGKILHELGWPVFDVGVVAPEFRVGRRTVDYALCNPPDRPRILLDVGDRAGASDHRETKLLDCCVELGAPIATLTDGRSWTFFFPGGQGSGDDRLIKRVDLVGDGAHECAMALDRYVRFSDVQSGAAVRRAERDYEAARAEREAAARYADVWDNLLRGPDTRVLGAFREEVERVAGIRPGRQSAAAFLRNQAGGTGGDATQPVTEPTRGGRDDSVSGDAGLEPPRDRFWYQMGEGKQSFRNGSELLVAIFNLLAARDPTFLERYAQRHYGSTRRHVASSQEELYDNPEMRQLGRRLENGWWIDCHCGSPQKEERIRNACRVAGIKFGRDLIVRCKPRPRRRRPVAPHLASTVEAPSVPATHGRASLGEAGLTRAEAITLKMRGTKN